MANDDALDRRDAYKWDNDDRFLPKANVPLRKSTDQNDAGKRSARQWRLSESLVGIDYALSLSFFGSEP